MLQLFIRYFHLSYPKQNDVYFIQVTSETDKSELINCRINKETEYERQKETIITWRDEQRGQEVALSFQDVEDTKKMLYFHTELRA